MGYTIVKGSVKIAMFSNLALALVLMVVGTVCFFPFGVLTSGKLSDRVYYRGNTDSKYVSIMFNVYWGTEYVSDILEILDTYEVKATFFIGGSWADDNTEILRNIADKGHELGNHGYFHKDQSKLTLEKNAEEIDLCGRLIEKLTDVKINLFAPPSGAYSEATVQAAEDLGYKVIMWSNDTIDWRDHDQTIIYKRATENIVGGDLVLAHPTRETVAALPSILTKYGEMGLKQVPVSVNISGNEEM